MTGNMIAEDSLMLLKGNVNVRFAFNELIRSYALRSCLRGPAMVYMRLEGIVGDVIFGNLKLKLFESCIILYTEVYSEISKRNDLCQTRRVRTSYYTI